MGLAIFHFAMQLIVVMPRNLAVTDHEENIQIYYSAAQHASVGEPLYFRQPVGTPIVNGGYLYCPFFAAVLIPIATILSFKTFVQIWYLIMFAAFWVFAWCLARLYFDDKIDIRKVLIWGLILDLFPGGYEAFSVGQIEPLLWALFGLGLVSIARPTLWTLCTFVKPFYMWPLFAEIVDAARSKGIKVLFRSLIPAIIIAIALVFCGGIICGWDSYLIWVRDVLPTLSQGSFNSGNVSISMAILRAARFMGWQYSGGPLPALAHLWLTATAILAPMLTWFLLRRHSTQIKSAALVAAAILFAPVCWTYYLPLLLPLFALLFQRRNHESTFNVPTQYQ